MDFFMLLCEEDNNGYDDDKNEVKKAIDALNLDIDLSKWKYGDIDGYEYYVIAE